MQDSLKDAQWRRRMMAALPGLTAGQKRVAEYVVAHPVDLAFMTTQELSMVTEVSEATIVRFARALGYYGYPALQQEIRELVTQAFSPAELMRISVKGGNRPSGDILTETIAGDIQSLQTSGEQISHVDFDRAVALLHDSPTLLILGTRALYSLAFYAYHFLNQIRPSVHLIENKDDRLADELIRADASYTALVFLFPRYAQRTTQIIQYLHERGCQLVVLADSLSAPGAEYASVLLPVQPHVTSFFRSQVAGMSVLNALMVGIARRDPDATRSQLDLLEGAFDFFGTHMSPSSGVEIDLGPGVSAGSSDDTSGFDTGHRLLSSAPRKEE